MRCAFCKVELKPVDDTDWKYLQPDNGCEVRIYPSWGSRFDRVDMKPHKGVVCDDCAAKMMPDLIDPGPDTGPPIQVAESVSDPITPVTIKHENPH